VDYDSGYVNNWNTNSFAAYVKEYNKNTLIVRDHGGPEQGSISDNGLQSLEEDTKYFDIIHIDPWKQNNNFNDGLAETLKLITFCFNKNKNIYFEVGTEESIRPFTPIELHALLSALKKNLPQQCFENIKYAVIQSGTALKETKQIGNYNSQKLIEMIQVVKYFNLLSKEHNGDYISPSIIKEKFNLGLDSINIAPEFGLIESLCYLEAFTSTDREQFFNLCLESNKWRKWVSKGFDPLKNKKELIKICGHYVFSYPEFKTILKKYDNISSFVEQKLILKLNELTRL
jgi:hypothetical protein